MLLNVWCQMLVLKQQHNCCSVRNCKDAIQQRSTLHAQRKKCFHIRRVEWQKKTSVVPRFVGQPHVWILSNLLKGIWKKCQFCEKRRTIIQQVDELSSCSTGFPLGMWQLLNVFISAVMKMHLCPGFVFSPSAAVTIPESSKCFCSPCIQDPLLPAEIWYFKLWLYMSRKGGKMPTALLTNLQMHRTFFFLFFFF